MLKLNILHPDSDTHDDHVSGAGQSFRGHTFNHSYSYQRKEVNYACTMYVHEIPRVQFTGHLRILVCTYQQVALYIQTIAQELTL